MWFDTSINFQLWSSQLAQGHGTTVWDYMKKYMKHILSEYCYMGSKCPTNHTSNVKVLLIGQASLVDSSYIICICTRVVLPVSTQSSHLSSLVQLSMEGISLSLTTIHQHQHKIYYCKPPLEHWCNNPFIDIGNVPLTYFVTLLSLAMWRHLFRQS